jgi:hypothetical protein
MSDESQRLHARVEELHRRLQTEGAVSGPLREELLRLLADVERLVQPAPSRPAPPPTPNSLAERLLEAGQRFETTHPVLGTTIGNLADALSRIGI